MLQLLRLLDWTLRESAIGGRKPHYLHSKRTVEHQHFLVVGQCWERHLEARSSPRSFGIRFIRPSMETKVSRSLYSDLRHPFPAGFGYKENMLFVIVGLLVLTLILWRVAREDRG